MDRFLDQLRLHPWTAILAGLAFLAGLVLLLRSSEGRSKPLSPVIGLALFAVSVGLASSIQGVVDTFHASALLGSAGQGAVAAGLAETRGAFLLGLLPAVLILAAGLLLGRSGSFSPVSGPGEGQAESGPRFSSPVILMSTALASIAVTTLGLYDLWFVSSLPGRIAHPTGTVAETSQSLATHINRLRFLSLWAVIASVSLFILPRFFSGSRHPSPRQTVWGRALLAILLVLSLIGGVMAWRQFAGFEEAAMTGKLF